MSQASAQSSPKSGSTHSSAAGHGAASHGAAAPSLGYEKYLNRETSWLAFNRRVMEEADSPHNPLLERVNFLSISANNLDEFFMKRIGGLQRQVGAGVTKLSMDGRSPQEQLTEGRRMVLEMLREQARILNVELLPQLRRHGVRIAQWDDLTDKQREWLTLYFERQILPILTPLGVGPGQPFPFISNLSLSLAVRVRAVGDDEERFGRVKVPSNRPRFVQLPPELCEGHVFLSLENLIANNMDRLFVGMEILETAPFRVTRNADVERHEEEADDLLEAIEEELRTRKFAPIVRLETSQEISAELLHWLVEEMAIDPAKALFQSPAMLGLDDLSQLARLDLPDLRFESFAPVSHPVLRQLEHEPRETDIFAIIRRNDLLLHHPYQSFATSVLGLLRAAAEDERVLAIKQTLYRTARNSPIVAALLTACERGKEVNVQVEIKARFDEANNIEWVRTLERAGAHVSYGFVGLKTHSKTLLIVRDEPDGVRRYAHIGTGNYHTGTARLYTDLGLFTCDPVLCQDVADLFNYLTGHSNFRDYHKLLVAPVNMRPRFLEMIHREVRHAQEGKPAHIFCKMNQLEDQTIIDALYLASQAGVKVDLIVRGFCCLRPGVKGLSENIRVMTILGRFLEHSRLYRFENDGQPEFYLGSADWMSRNLDWRVEAITPIESPVLQRELDHILKTCWTDQSQAWDLAPTGAYDRRRPRRGRGSQNAFMKKYGRSAKD